MPSVSQQQKFLVILLGLWTLLVVSVFLFYALTNVNGAQSHKNDDVEMMIAIYLMVGGISVLISLLVWLSGRIWTLHEDPIVRAIQLCTITMVGIAIPVSLGAALAG